MRRVEVSPRPDWREKVLQLGFDWHSSPTEVDPSGVYWDESAYWHLTAGEVEVLEAATDELHTMCMAAADHAIGGNLLSHFGFDQKAIVLINESWAQRAATPTIYGRFDLAYCGDDAGDATPKMLEYNADTPTGIYEAAVVQWAWLQECFPKSDQFNSIHEALVAAWAKNANALSRSAAGLHFTSLAPHAEDEGTLRYLLDTALEAGLRAKIVSAKDIGWSVQSDRPEVGEFVDLEDMPIRSLFKLVPWDWLLADEFGARLAEQVLRKELTVVEPAWKMVLSNKAILAVLWELYPNHPLLLPAYLDRRAFPPGSTVVAKPLLGREGANISIAKLGENGALTGAPLVSTDGNYGAEGYLYQLLTTLVEATTSDGQRHRAVIGSWHIDGACRGIGIREEAGLVTTNRSRFIPHRFE